MLKETSMILTPTAPGELIDKITILRIKSERISDPARLMNVNTELKLLEEARQQHFPTDPNIAYKVSIIEEGLKKANEALWDLEDKIRELDEKKDFGQEFINTSRSIYSSNDRRAALKKEINLLLGSAIVEEKSYKNWK